MAYVGTPAALRAGRVRQGGRHRVGDQRLPPRAHAARPALDGSDLEAVAALDDGLDDAGRRARRAAGSPPSPRRARRRRRAATAISSARGTTCAGPAGQRAQHRHRAGRELDHPAVERRRRTRAPAACARRPSAPGPARAAGRRPRGPARPSRARSGWWRRDAGGVQRTGGHRADGDRPAPGRCSAATTRLPLPELVGDGEQAGRGGRAGERHGVDAAGDDRRDQPAHRGDVLGQHPAVDRHGEHLGAGRRAAPRRGRAAGRRAAGRRSAVPPAAPRRRTAGGPAPPPTTPTPATTRRPARRRGSRRAPWGRGPAPGPAAGARPAAGPRRRRPRASRGSRRRSWR